MGSTNCKERSPVSNMENDEFVEAVVCQEADLKDNEMRVVEVGGPEQKVLLVKQGGSISAVGTKCTHYGAPLVNGALGEGRVRCPWHGACFNLKTGDIEDFPGLDSLPCYEVKVEAGGVKVRARRADLAANKRVRTMARRDPNNHKTVVVIGGGGAGATCVESLRQENFTGRVVLVSREPHIPLDRPKLTKAMDSTPEKLALRTKDFYKSFDIELMLGVEVTQVDTATKTLTFTKGEPLPYDALFIATGSDPREVRDTPGGTLKNIMPLRTAAQANSIAKDARGKTVVVLGNSFIGMEVAAYLSDKAASVTVVGRSQVPFEAVLGREVGARLAQVFADAKVTVIGGRSVSSFREGATPGAVGAVILDDGTELPAEMCLLGLGTMPATSFLQGTPVQLDPRSHCVLVDKSLASSVPGIWAGGDAAATPLTINGTELQGIAIGHWQIAHYHGKVAAANITATLKKKPEVARELKTVPFFWTMFLGKGVRYAGYGAGFEEVKIVGDLAALKFAAYYLKDGAVVAIATMNSDPLAAKFAERLAQRKPPLTKSMLEQDPEAWTKQV